MSGKRRWKLFGRLGCLALLGVILPAAVRITPVQARMPAPLARSGRVEVVNLFRASQGLVPDSVDPWWMDHAQEHADYQASIDTSGTSTQSPGTDLPFISLVTVTPRPDGTIVHIVGYGQTLWAIAVAYGVKIDDIRGLNGLAEGSTDIYEGQRLIIRLPGPGTPTWDGKEVEPAVTESTPTVTRTHRPTATQVVLASRTPRPTLTALPTVTETPARLLPFSLPDNRTLGLILFAISGVGILLLLVFGFRKEVK